MFSKARLYRLQLNCDKYFNQFKEFVFEILKIILPGNIVSNCIKLYYTNTAVKVLDCTTKTGPYKVKTLSWKMVFAMYGWE